MTDVSQGQGHGSLAAPSVTTAHAHSVHHSKRPILFSQFRGPPVLNMAETEEERLKREEDEKNQSNFKKVQEAREREAEARKKAEAERDTLLKEKEEREERDRKAEEQKLADEKRFEELAKQKEAEAKAKADEAAAERTKRESAEAELAEFKKAQQDELDALLKQIPEEKRPPLSDSMTVPDRLKIVRHTMSMLGQVKPPVGAGFTPPPKEGNRRSELLKKGINNLSPDEALELAGLSE